MERDESVGRGCGERCGMRVWEKGVISRTVKVCSLVKVRERGLG